MKRWLARASERLDALSLRERTLVFITAAAAVVAVMDAALLQPRLAQEKRMAGLLAQRQGELREMQDQMQKSALAREADPDKETRTRLMAAKQALTDLERRISEEQRKFTAPDQVRVVLEEMLARNAKLRLVDLRTLPPVALARSRAPAPEAKPRPGAAAGGDTIYRHGVELTVSGAYLDLLAYLSDLERLPTQVYWGGLDLRVQEHPAITLKLTVYTLSFDRAWMRV